MTITNQNAKIYRGDNAQIKVTLETAEGDVYTPAPGDEVKYRIARNAHSPDSEAFVIKELDDGLTILAGVATIEITSEETALMEPGLYHHQIKIVDPPLERSTVMTGTVIVKAAMPMVTPP